MARSAVRESLETAEFFGHRLQASVTCATAEDRTAGLDQALRTRHHGRWDIPYPSMACRGGDARRLSWQLLPVVPASTGTQDATRMQGQFTQDAPGSLSQKNLADEKPRPHFEGSPLANGVSRSLADICRCFKVTTHLLL